MNSSMSFRMDDDNLLVQYEIAFPKKPLLLGTEFGGGSGRAGNGAYIGVAEILDDHVKWEPCIDEADKLDYIVAVSSGVLAGLMDVFYVGEFSLEHASEWGKAKIEQIVMKVARLEGYQGDELSGAIKVLERCHVFAADGNTDDFGGGLQHHLRDFSHHFSIGGLLFSVLTQFTGLVVGTDKAGNLRIVPVPESHRSCIGKNFQEKVVFGVIGWFFHMVSDMAGSSGSLVGGTGVPGPLVSLMKEFSALPFFKDSDDGDMNFRLWVSKLFGGTLLAKRDANGKIIKGSVRKFDLRTEVGILGEACKQATPVLINQCVVRGFYFCRRTLREIRDLGIEGVGDLARIAPEDILPWGTPAMRRMVSVSSGVFAGVDIVDAAVRAIKRKEPTKFFLRVNYVGVATFVIACVVDARESLGEKRGENAEDLYERALFDLNHFKLDFQKARVLHSIMYRMVSYDIASEKHDKRRERKRIWLNEWSDLIVNAVDRAWLVDADYFLDEDEIYKAIANFKGSNDSWVWLVAMEALLFKAYAPLPDGRRWDSKGMKLAADYLSDVFCERCAAVTKKELKELGRAVDSARGVLDGAASRRIVGTAGVVVVVAATGGLAFYFAPAIAPVFAAALGANTAALTGAVLTSASLAFLGGGALAAGGAGMAGGTMLIFGGGALLGAVGGSGVSAAISMALATGASYVLNECAKLVVFCEEVLIGRYGDLDSAAEAHAALNKQIVELEVKIEAIKRGVPAVDTADGEIGEDQISPKKILKILKRSQKFLKRSSDRIAKAIEVEKKRRS